MNKLTKVGCSALCGSLAAVSAANAGDLSVTGGADLTYVSISGTGPEVVTGNPIGMASAVTFKGSGELDNGWTFALTIAEGDASAYSSSNIDIVMGGLGSINFDQGDSGNGIAAYDNVMPTAWEEAHGAGLSGTVKTVLGSGSSQNIMYTTPTILGTTIAYTYAHDLGTTDVADKTTSATGDTIKGQDLTMKISGAGGIEILSGLNMYFGVHNADDYDISQRVNDKWEGVSALTYDLGPVSIGWMVSGLYDGDESARDAFHTYKNKAYGIAFNVNDDLSVSYGMYESRKVGVAHRESVLTTGEEDRTVEVTSWQAAYTMGGASVRVADVNADNAGFTSANDQTATIMSLSLAF